VKARIDATGAVSVIAVSLLRSSRTNLRSGPVTTDSHRHGPGPRRAYQCAAAGYRDGDERGLTQPLVLENSAGAGGTIAADAVARSQPDGYTPLLAGSNILGLGLLVNKSVRYAATSCDSIGGIARAIRHGCAAVAARKQWPLHRPCRLRRRFDEFPIEPWYGLVAPAGTSIETIALLASNLRDALRTTDVRRQFERLGYVPLDSTPAETDSIIEREVKTFKPVIDAERRWPR